MTTVILDFDIEGFHFYPNPPKKVNFLAHKHRHIFQIRIGYKVDDLNREKEIFIQQDFIKDYLIESYGNPCNFGDMSCEMIAEELLQFTLDDGGVWVEIFEDGKGGARVEK
tara:strand:+ start:112 stop:444 length:333 start_codon:yes stop_codon:yes gene_type:complete